MARMTGTAASPYFPARMAWNFGAFAPADGGPSSRMARSGRAVVDSTVGDLTDVLRLAAGGDTEAQDRLFQLLVPTLRQMAAARMARERPGHTLSPTALVNEAFVRLARQDSVPA